MDVTVVAGLAGSAATAGHFTAAGAPGCQAIIRFLPVDQPRPALPSHTSLLRSQLFSATHTDPMSARFCGDRMTGSQQCLRLTPLSSLVQSGYTPLSIIMNVKPPI